MAFSSSNTNQTDARLGSRVPGELELAVQALREVRERGDVEDICISATEETRPTSDG